jgi:putative ATP-dependent endonuclease of OLD family
MKLVSFAVRNFRSITGTSKLTIRDGMTTLIGPNNEGKSNVLSAMVVALEIATRFDEYKYLRGGRLRLLSRSTRPYQWSTDFPVGLQQSKPDGCSEFDMEFRLTSQEIDEFWNEIGSSLNGTLPVKITIGPTETTFSVSKKGRGAKALTAKASKIGTFIAKRLDLQHIPAVRPAAKAMGVVQSIVSREFQGLLRNTEYQAAVNRIEELQAPVLHEISRSIRDTLRVFLPEVRDVQVHVSRDAGFRALTGACEVVVDDGSPTSLAAKGDGVQSLAALSLMRHASQTNSDGKIVILAIEEPESHLHPNAIHQLRGVLGEIAKLHQVIITTHCPLFVDRHEAKSNILVSKNRAKPAASIQELRQVMGVRVSDNLVAAEVLLMVEGEDDRRAIRVLLAHYSTKLRRALESGRLGIDTLGGGGNLTYKLTMAREAMCVTHSLLDSDQSGREAVSRALSQGVLQVADVSYTSCLGMQESELEDWYHPTQVATVVASALGVPAESAHFSGTKKKWSDRMRELCISSGKPWDASVEAMLKYRVAEFVSTSPELALLLARKSAFDTLVANLEEKLRTASSF